MTSLAEQYLDAVQAGLTGLEQQLSSIAAAATRAAERACAGGRVWALSDEEGFVSELQHRASGLMMVRGIPGGDTFELDDAVSAGDVVLAGTQDRAAERQGALLDGLAERGVAVTLIGSADSPLRPKASAFIDTGLPAGSAPVLPYGDATVCPLARRPQHLRRVALEHRAGQRLRGARQGAGVPDERRPRHRQGPQPAARRQGLPRPRRVHDRPVAGGSEGARAAVRVAPLPGRHPARPSWAGSPRSEPSPPPPARPGTRSGAPRSATTCTPSAVWRATPASSG